MPEQLIWSDEWEGSRFTYGLTYRPATMGSVPSGFILGVSDPGGAVALATPLGRQPSSL